MRKLYSLAIFVSFLMAIFVAQNTDAISQNLVISQIKAGNSSASRLVEIYNNSDNPVDITGWCLEYSSPSNTSPYTNLGCFSNPNPDLHVFINARSYALLASSQVGLLNPDILLTAGLGAGVSGHVYLMDHTGVEIDRIGWGEAVNAEGNNPIVLDSTKVVERRPDLLPGVLVDTDNNGNDFINSSLRQTYQYGLSSDSCNNIDGLQEVIPDGFIDNGDGGCSLLLPDFCPNLDGVQSIIPSGYLLDSSGNCTVDVCLNIVGLQQAVPDNMNLDGQGNCLPRDLCVNLSGIQAVIPDGYILSNGICKINVLPLKISELLPNAVGSDEGNEFIEIFNPNNSDLDLANYYLVISGVGKAFGFPSGSRIKTNEYLAFLNNDIKFTLLNTTNTVQLTSKTGDLFDETPAYNDPKEGFSWALIDDVWQYTNQPTPNAFNLASKIEHVVDEVDTPVKVVESGLVPCAANQYRSPETNRCRQIVSVTPTQTPCKDGQYRSEETNRCRNITADVSGLTQCAEGQERNPETNRCRTVAILGTSELAPCKEGQERNPETNRCRNVASSMPQANYAPRQTSQPENNYVLWWSIAGVGLVAIVYGVWEWRQEIGKIIRKIGGFLGRHHK